MKQLIPITINILQIPTNTLFQLKNNKLFLMLPTITFAGAGDRKRSFEKLTDHFELFLNHVEL